MTKIQAIREKAWEHHRQQKWIKAEETYREILRLGPDDSDISNYGALLRSRGRGIEAYEIYQKWWGRITVTPNLSLNAVNAALETNNYNTATAWIKEALVSYPENLSLNKANARIEEAKGNPNRAIEILQVLLRESKGDVDIYLQLGKIQNSINKKVEALKSFQNGSKYDAEDERCWANQITILNELGRFKDAEEMIDSLEEKIKKSTLTKAAIAYLLLKKNDMVKAAELYSELCEKEPLQGVYWLNRSACYRAIKKGHKALATIKQGLTFNPKHKDLKRALLQCCGEQGKREAAKKLIAEELNNKERSDECLFNLQFLGEGYKLIDSNNLRDLAQKWEKQIMEKGPGELWGDRINECNKRRKITIGYMSADICNHPVGRFIYPVVKNHDKEKFEIVVINCGRNEDHIHNKIKECCDRWIDIKDLDEIEAARKIANSKIDIIVELGGYTANSKINVLCHKPARIQLSYLGYFAPTYLKSIDGWIGDDMLFQNLEKQHRKDHKLLKIRGGYMAYVEEIKPNIVGHKGKEVCFGSFNHSRKLSKGAIELFTNILEQVERSKLVLKSINFVEQEEKDRIAYEFNSRGISNERLIILPYSEGRENHLKCYNEIDIALDPFPYGGATTTCEALIMGVPVITLAGKTMVENLSASILMSSNYEEWIAYNKTQYINKAKYLAEKGVRNQEDRIYQRHKIENSNLCNPKRVSSELEKIYREALDILEKADSK